MPRLIVSRQSAPSALKARGIVAAFAAGNVQP
jgi:hypothetical protein